MKLFEKVFGIDRKKAESMMKEPPLESGEIEYMGGHKAYPSALKSEIHFYQDRFVILAYNITVPYASIKDISNSNEKKRDADHFILAGVIGYAIWKKNHIYTIIEYDDGTDVQRIVIDFYKNVNYAQALIYKKMLESRKNQLIDGRYQN
jgi:hypothetical protein